MVKQFSRRAFGRLWAGSALYVGTERTGLAAVERRLELEGQPRADLSLDRHYRADAQVIILSVPLLHRTSVGGGSVQWMVNGLGEWWFAAPDRVSRILAPEQTRWIEPAGIHPRTNPHNSRRHSRCGLFRPDDGLERRKRWLEEARKALHSNATESAYTVIEGRISGGRFDQCIGALHGAVAHLSRATR